MTIPGLPDGVFLLHPWMLLLALLLPLALLLRARRGNPALALAPLALFPAGLPRSWRVRLLPLPVALDVLALLLVVVALARPVRAAPLPLRAEGIDILLCLDLSSSMTARDMDRKRTRLGIAKDAAEAFVRGRPRDRIGLVGFARFPDLLCPPTLDHDALVGLLRAAAPVEGDGPEDATGIGTAAARAAGALRGGASRSKVVILLTDGEENVAATGDPAGIAPAHAARLCQELGVRVYAIAAGSPGPGTAPGRAAVDTGPVRRLAERTGGRFFEARDAGSLERVYADIDALERARFERPRTRLEERFRGFAAAGLALLLLARILRVSGLEALP